MIPIVDRSSDDRIMKGPAAATGLGRGLMDDDTPTLIRRRNSGRKTGKAGTDDVKRPHVTGCIELGVIGPTYRKADFYVTVCLDCRMTSTKLTYCANEVRANDRDRFLTVLFAPPEHRDALFALYAFNIEVAKTREAVSERMLGQVRLQWWREAIGEAYSGTLRPHEVMQALGPVIAGRGLSRAHFDRLIDAREYDLDEQPLPTMAALEDYAVETSATLSWLALEVLGVSGKNVSEAAGHVGVAWALTGLLRVLPLHASAKRVYLPSDLMARHGFDRERLVARTPPQKLGRAVAEIADAARDHLAASRSLRSALDTAALPVLLPAVITKIYLRQLARAGHDPYAVNASRPASLPLVLAVSAFFKLY
jgi:NADH dehydrogenase [ubiquinone] 1 alpha subcomplex assembly factor 6